MAHEGHVEVRARRGGEDLESVSIAPGSSVLVGRDASADLRLRDLSVSRAHVRLSVADARRLRVEDLGSTDGTYLGGVRLGTDPMVVDLPCRLEVGRHQLVARWVGSSGASAATGVWTDYQKLRLLGQGGYGRVYSARRHADGQEVAIKELHLRGDAEGRARFLREVRLTARLDDPNLVRVLEVREEGEVAYQVMELIPYGRDLHDWIDEEGALRVEDTLTVAEGMARGLGVIHAAGLVHRDLKPANVMLTPDDEAKITDFGLARRMEQGETLTKSLMGVGTLGYVAPEQAEDAKRAGAPADLYGLGATLYHVLVGEPPFDGDSLQDVMIAIAERPPDPVIERRSDCPPRLSALVDLLLHKDPEARPSVEEVLGEVAAIRAELD
jgi:serine/threonine-protein kinase